MKCEEIMYKGKKIVVIVDDDGNIIPEVARYLVFLLSYRSIYTIRSYAYRLLLFYRYLKMINADVFGIWDDKNKTAINYLSDFFLYIRHPETSNKKVLYHFSPKPAVRKNISVNSIMYTVLRFYSYLFMNKKNEQFEKIYSSGVINSRSFGFLSELMYTKQNKRMKVLKVKETPKSLKYITHKEYEKLCNATTTLRDEVILGLMYEAGMRIGEVLGVRMCDLINLQNGSLSIVYREDNLNEAHVKYYSERIVGLKKGLARKVVQLVCEMEKYKSDYLFLALEGRRRGLPLLINSAQRTLKNIGIRAGLPDFHAHLCRHGYAMSMLNEYNFPLDLISEILGHKSIESTKIYADYKEEYIREVMCGKSDNDKILVPQIIQREGDFIE